MPTSVHLTKQQVSDVHPLFLPRPIRSAPCPPCDQPHATRAPPGMPTATKWCDTRVSWGSFSVTGSAIGTVPQSCPASSPPCTLTPRNFEVGMLDVIFQFLLISFIADPDEGNHLDGNLPPTQGCSEEPTEVSQRY